MTTTEGNKLIAEFMGGKPYRVMVKSIGMMDAYQWGENGYTIDELQYHSNWNMLMPVVEKIEDGGRYSVSIENTHCCIDDTEGYLDENFEWVGMQTIRVENKRKIESTYNAVVKFIQTTTPSLPGDKNKK